MENKNLKHSLINAAFKWLNFELKDYVWYFDTPEQRFKHTSGSIWLINPNTKEWAFELSKSGHLWYFHYIRNNFLELFPINDIEFEEIVKLWVEDALKRGVTTEVAGVEAPLEQVEDALKRGVTTDVKKGYASEKWLEDALKIGVTTKMSVKRR